MLTAVEEQEQQEEACGIDYICGGARRSVCVLHQQLMFLACARKDGVGRAGITFLFERRDILCQKLQESLGALDFRNMHFSMVDTLPITPGFPSAQSGVRVSYI